MSCKVGGIRLQSVLCTNAVQSCTVESQLYDHLLFSSLYYPNLSHSPSFYLTNLNYFDIKHVSLDYANLLSPPDGLGNQGSITNSCTINISGCHYFQGEPEPSACFGIEKFRYSRPVVLQVRCKK